MAHFPIFGSKKSFSEKFSSVTHNLRVSSTLAKFRETWQILLQGTFPATTWGPTSTTPVDWHLKIKDIEYDVGLTKNHCITVSMQKISSVHNLILKVRQILGSHELNGHTHFDHAHPQIIESTFSFLEFAPACKKSFHSIYSILRYSQFLSPVTSLATPVFEHPTLQLF